MERKMYVTGDTHGVEERFTNDKYAYNRDLKEGDILFVCGDFGYVSDDSYKERQFLKYLANEKPNIICFVDGNHENHKLLNELPIENWNGGNVHVVRKDIKGNPKVIHLMRGQVYEIYGKKIFTFGGGYSLDKARRKEGIDWFKEEMPTNEEKDIAFSNLKRYGFKVDYILTHTADEETMSLFDPTHENEKDLNLFLQEVKEKTEYKHWYFGHMHDDKELFNNQTLVYFGVRDMLTNKMI